MTFGSLFAGIGGFDLGFERAGLTCAWQVEISEPCRRVLKKHWPSAVGLKDVREASGGNLSRVDVVCGGFPCQDLSLAGNRAGFGGKRSVLFFEMVRIIHELQPQFVVWENVPGLLTSDRGRDFARVLRALGDIGYFGAWRVLDSQWFGLPQQRARVFGIFANCGSSEAWQCAAEILAVTDNSEGDDSPGRREEDKHSTRASVCAGAAGRPVIFERRIARCGRGQPSEIAHALRGYEAGETSDARPMVLDGDVIRRLTPVEWLRLQGFPDYWLDVAPAISDAAQYQMAGNAVSVPVSRWIGRRLIENNESA